MYKNIRKLLDAERVISILSYLVAICCDGMAVGTYESRVVMIPRNK